MKSCGCAAKHTRKRIVLTGGPGAGKTAVLELVRQEFCAHVQVLPEAAGIVFGGGFPRTGSLNWLRAAQRAIFFVQAELENTGDADNAAIVLCDRGTVDGAAYWPGPDSFWESVGTTQERETSRYDAVIHLRTPTVHNGYNNENPLRIESASTAAEIDERLMRIWEGHPRRFVVPASQDFLEKAARVVEILKAEMPDCCRDHKYASAGSDGSTCSTPRSVDIDRIPVVAADCEALQSQHAAHR
jgi:predicted ATPase